jgi:hypothetical protein
MGWYAGAGGRSVFGPASATGDAVSSIDPEFGTIDCNWNMYFSISSATTGGWTTGFYLVKLNATSGKQSYIIFVLRDDASNSKFLFQSAVANWQAYNSWPGPRVGLGSDGGFTNSGIGKSIYCPRRAKRLRSAEGVLQPVMNMGSAGGESSNLNVTSTIGSGEFLAHLNSDRYDTVGGWDYNMVRFLEREGYDISYNTSIDTHEMASSAAQGSPLG